ncbi:hypothetical protein GCM10010523_32210 [Paenarthrobacter ilicis]
MESSAAPWPAAAWLLELEELLGEEELEAELPGVPELEGDVLDPVEGVPEHAASPAMAKTATRGRANRKRMGSSWVASILRWPPL